MEDLAKLLEEELPSVDCTEVENFWLDSPANVLLLGTTQAGKTHTAFELIRNFPRVFKNCGRIKNIVIVYSVFEQYYDDFVTELKQIYPGVNIVVIDGFYLEKIMNTKNFEYDEPNQESILFIGK